MPTTREFLLLASYCDGDKGEDCTVAKPCKECLGMCNIFTIPDATELEYIRELGEVCE